MGREGHETIAVSSSISLLQERFRQLERAKEMREERALLKNVDDAPSRLFFQSDLIVPLQRSNSPVQQVSLSLWPAFETDHRLFVEDKLCHCCTADHELLGKLWHWDAPLSPFRAASSKLGFDDVDTSLHL